MDHVEAADEVDSAIQIPMEPLHIRLKDMDRPPQQPEIRTDHDPGSQETFLEVLTGKGMSSDHGEQSRSSKDPAVTVEELTVKNYTSPSLDRSTRRGLWTNFAKMAGTSRDEDARVGMGSPVSGFQQFLLRSILKGKGVLQQNQEGRNKEIMDDKVKSVSKTLHKPGARQDGKALFGGGGGINISDGVQEGISLREWLMQRQRKLSNYERLKFFRQIVEFVDTTHSQGLAVRNLRPSCFMILPVNQVKYIGTLVPEGQLGQRTDSIDGDIRYLEHNNSKRKSHLQPETEDNLLRKHQKHGEKNHMDVQHNVSSRVGLKGNVVHKIDPVFSKTGNSESEYSRHMKLSEVYHGASKSESPSISSFRRQLSKSEILKLEERWYASPEELNESKCYLSSNIYHLGVLLFELFCDFETWEVHYAAMSDLRHRILPPNFLSESPKEANFCIWLLHPEPSSRPKSRDILTSGLVWEERHTSSLNQSALSINEEEAEADLLSHFLLISKDQKEKQATKLVADLGCLQSDIEEVKRRHSLRTECLSSTRDLWSNSGESRFSTSSTNKDGFKSNIDQLENAYFSMRSKIDLSETNAAPRSDKDVLKIRDNCFQVPIGTDARREPTDRVGAFFKGLCKYARYSRFEVCGNLRSVDILNSTNVICSLSFDRDEEYFASAGVSKKIKIFEFDSLLHDSVDIHYPLIEMSSRSMLSCVSWNNYIKNYLASAGYDGVIQLWDASTGQGFAQYTEHQKRAWSVDFSQTDPVRLASGSDDCSVKLWSINERNCINTIRSTANVCCVKFSSYSSHLLTLGSADYKIYGYDLRNTRIPWCTLTGHGKAVSYVKFIDSETLVSASTDNTLKLWDLTTGTCSLTFRGHTNEKNFVGLSVCDGYIACGSETNEVYAYYKTFCMPITSHKFGSINPITGQETENDNGQSVSSVCWRTKSNVLVAGSSTGSIKLLRLV